MHQQIDFLLFLTSSVLLILAPGPDILFAMTQSLNHGRKAALLTVLGLALGNMVHITLVALGVVVFLKNFPIVFTLIKVFGALYLSYLAFSILWIRNHEEKIGNSNPDKSGLEIKKRNIAPWKHFARGFLMNVLNPKVALFFLSFFPQFLDPSVDSLNSTATIFFLGGIFMALVLIIFGSFAFAAAKLHAMVSEKSQFKKVMSYLSASIFLALALKLFF